MVKYTGYGNAAGFLAKRGALFGGGKNSDLRSSAHCSSDRGALFGGGRNSDLRSSAQYSSDSEDSDTEEYKEFRSQ
jgi:hypothetical protein